MSSSTQPSILGRPPSPSSAFTYRAGSAENAAAPPPRSRTAPPPPPTLLHGPSGAASTSSSSSSARVASSSILSSGGAVRPAVLGTNTTLGNSLRRLGGPTHTLGWKPSQQQPQDEIIITAAASAAVVVLPRDEESPEDDAIQPTSTAHRFTRSLTGSIAAPWSDASVSNATPTTRRGEAMVAASVAGGRRVTPTPPTPQRNAPVNSSIVSSVDATSSADDAVTVSRSPSPEPSNPRGAGEPTPTPLQAVFVNAQPQAQPQRHTAAAAAPVSLRWRYADAEALLSQPHGKGVAPSTAHHSLLLGNRRPPILFGTRPATGGNNSSSSAAAAADQAFLGLGGASSSSGSVGADATAVLHRAMDILLAMRAKQHAATLQLVVPWARQTKVAMDEAEALRAQLRDARRLAKAEATRAAVDARRRERFAGLVEAETSQRAVLALCAVDGIFTLSQAFEAGLSSLQNQHRLHSDREAFFEACIAGRDAVAAQSHAEAWLALRHAWLQDVAALSALKCEAREVTEKALPSSVAAAVPAACDGCVGARRQLQAAEQRHQREERALLATIVRKDAEVRAAKAEVAAAEVRLAEIARLPTSSGNLTAACPPPPGVPSDAISQLVAARRSSGGSAFTSPAFVTGGAKLSIAASATTIASTASQTDPPPASALRPAMTSASDGVGGAGGDAMHLAEALAKAAVEMSTLRSQRDRLADTVRRLMEARPGAPSSSAPSGGATSSNTAARMPRVTFAPVLAADAHHE